MVKFRESVFFSFVLFVVKMSIHEYEIHGSDDAEECCRMIPLQRLILEHDVCYDGKHHQGDTFLYDLQLNE